MKFIVFIGDVHGNFTSLSSLLAGIRKRNVNIQAFIQLGDFGIFPQKDAWQTADKWKKVYPGDAPFYFIGGNHERWDILGNMVVDSNFAPVVNLHSTLNFITDGSRLNIAGVDCLFVGGAMNQIGEPNYIYGLKNGAQITNYCSAEEVKKFLFYQENLTPDFLITHGIYQATVAFPTWGDASLNPLRQVKPRQAHILGHLHRRTEWQEHQTKIVVVPEAIDRVIYFYEIESQTMGWLEV